MDNEPNITILDKQDLTIYTEKVKKQDLRKYWSKEQINTILDTIKNPEHRMLIQFLWMSGVRITEAISLTKENIDFQKYMITVKWLKSRKYNYRVLPLHPRLRELLMLYTASMLNQDRVFPITRQRAWQLTRKYLDGHPHQLRHSFAVNWLSCGGDITILHRILGHSKIQTTMEYLKIVPVDQGKELIKISF